MENLQIGFAMKFNKEINDHIISKSFSAGLNVSFGAEKFPDKTRIEKLLEITKDKKVIHVGCADHLPLIEAKIKNNRWLHGLLLENTAVCIGIDNNEEAVHFINEKLGVKNVFFMDITKENDLLKNGSHWDYIILGEIIEHIDNPVDFLRTINKLYADIVDKIIITAPNVFNLGTIKDIKNNRENINTDHRYWFSPFTLTKIVFNSGFKDIEIYFADRVSLPLIRKITNRIKLLLGLERNFKANCFSNIVLIADFV